MVDVSRALALATLPKRPPTPPKETGIGKVVEEANEIIAHLTIQSLSTPDDSPSSSADYFVKSSNRILKRVDFSPWTEYHKFPNTLNKGLTLDQAIRVLPPSKECKSSRSILKPYDRAAQSDGADGLSTFDRKSLPRMLDDIVRELASASRGSRLDGYMTLNGCLKAYDDVPDPNTIAEKMTLLTQFIRRDLCAELAISGMTDTQLVGQAVKLLTIFLWTPALEEHLSDDFRSFIADKSVAMVENPSTTKALVNYYMQLLATQNFRSKIMSSERVERLLASLDQITNHIKGNSVVVQRLMIFQRLLAQAKSSMITRAPDWIDHLFSGMLSTIKEIRLRAISFGIEASLQLGTTPSVSRAVSEIFNRQSPEGTKFIELLLNRLSAMISTGSKDDGIHVPQIWSVAILFLRSRRRQLEQWEHMKKWLWIIQKCFNSNDEKVKFQANIAWSRLIFAVGPDTMTGHSMIRMLRQPIVAQLDRRVSDKHSKMAKQIARTTYCTLLYYAFRPSATVTQLDFFWEEYVVQILPRILANGRTDIDFACQILVALLGSLQPQPWTDKRGDYDGPIKPEDLPRLDPRWIRSKSACILAVFETIWPVADWLPVNDAESWIVQAWQSFTRALADAGGKEVKTSMECMTAIAHILCSIKRYWELQKKSSPLADRLGQTVGLNQVMALINQAVNSLGAIPFNEKRLLQSQDSFEAAETPSNRLTKSYGTLTSPIVHLLSMLTTLMPGKDGNQTLRDAMNDLVRIGLRSATSRRSSLKFLGNAVHILTTQASGLSPAQIILWESVMEPLLESLDLPHSKDHASNSPHYAGQDYKEIVKILEVGITQGYIAISPSVAASIERIISQIRREVGIGAVTLAITEPLAYILCQEKSGPHDSVHLLYATAVARSIVWPESRREMDYAQRLLWGASATAPKSLSFNPFDQLYSMIDRMLVLTYQGISKLCQDDIILFLEVVISFITSCPLSHLGILLKRIQQGLGIWIEDADGRTSTFDSGSHAQFSITRQFRRITLAAIQKLPKKDGEVLTALEPLMFSILSSRHSLFVNEAIDTWNNTFGRACDLEYSQRLRTVLLRLSCVAELQLPGLRIDDEDTEVESSPFNYIDTQGSQDKFLVQPEGRLDNHLIPSSLPSIKVRSDPPSESSSPLPFHVSRRTPEPSERERAITKTPTARLRHDNSQIQFTAIELSPIGPDKIDPQLLTDRQKEVRERQQQDASTLFPDLRSSPRPKSRNFDRELPKLVMSSDRPVIESHDYHATLSPTFSPVNALLNDFLGSSPTPRLSKKSSSHKPDEDKTPSSPPLITYLTSLTQVDGPQSSPLANTAKLIGIEQKQEFVQDLEAMDTGDSNQTQRPTTTREHTPMSWINEEVNKNQSMIPPTGSAVTAVEGHGGSGKNALPNASIFIDAPSSPGKFDLSNSRSIGDSESLSMQYDKKSVSAKDLRVCGSESAHKPYTSTTKSVREKSRPGTPSSGEYKNSMNTSRKDRSDSISDHEELLSTQIALEMDRALSQATERSQQSFQTVSQTIDSTKKRKRSSHSPASIMKKPKPRSPGRTVQVVVQRRNSVSEEEDIHDCIIVESPSITATRISDNQGDNIEQQRRPKIETVHDRKNTLDAPEPSRSDKKPSRESTLTRSVLSGTRKRECNSRRYSCTESETDESIAPSSASRRRLARLSRSANVSDDERGAIGVSQASKAILAEVHQECSNRDTENKATTDALRHVERPTTNHVSDTYPHIQSGITVAQAQGKLDDPTRGMVDITSAATASSHLDDPGSVNLVTERPIQYLAEVAKPQQLRPPSGKAFLDAMKRMLIDAKHVVLGPGEGRQVMSAWMDLGTEIQKAQDRAHS